jgi:hypothetical protein
MKPKVGLNDYRRQEYSLVFKFRNYPNTTTTAVDNANDPELKEFVIPNLKKVDLIFLFT